MASLSLKSARKCKELNCALLQNAETDSPSCGVGARIDHLETTADAINNLLGLPVISPARRWDLNRSIAITEQKRNIPVGCEKGFDRR